MRGRGNRRREEEEEEENVLSPIGHVLGAEEFALLGIGVGLPATTRFTAAFVLKKFLEQLGLLFAACWKKESKN